MKGGRRRNCAYFGTVLAGLGSGCFEEAGGVSSLAVLWIHAKQCAFLGEDAIELCRTDRCKVDEMSLLEGME